MQMAIDRRLSLKLNTDGFFPKVTDITHIIHHTTWDYIGTTIVLTSPRRVL